MEKTKQNKGLLALIVLIIVVQLISCVSALLNNPAVNYTVLTLIAAAEHLLALYYVLHGYKKPHGNLLKFVMIAFILTLCVETIAFLGSNALYYSAINIVCMILMTYASGRLNKIGENRVIMTLVLVLLIISGTTLVIEFNPDSIFRYVVMYGKALEWLVLCCAYFVRYKAHKEAGLADK